MVMKAALDEAIRRQGVSIARVARSLDVAETELRRMIDPRRATRCQRLVDALERLGTHVRVALSHSG